MRKGKASESVLRRSVLRQIKTKREEVQNGAGVGEDCAVLAFGGTDTICVTVNPAVTADVCLGRHAVNAAANNLAASGAEPAAVLLTMLFPENTEEAEVRELTGQAEQMCGELRIQLAGGHTEITDAVARPVITAAGIGRKGQVAPLFTGKPKPGQDIIMTKWIGLQGTVLIANQKEPELLKRFPPHYIQEAKRFEQYLSVVLEAACALRCGCGAMHDGSGGGIFGALWELAARSGAGIEIDLKKIPVRQETVELCEYFGLNPYQLHAGGALLITAENGAGLARRLEKEGIQAAVIGQVTDNHDRVVVNHEERRFLQLPQPDEIHKIL